MNVRQVLWRARRLLKNWRRLSDLADAPVGARVRIRKSRIRRLLDLAYIAIRWDEYSTAYYAQGGDASGFSVKRDLITLGLFNKIRDEWNFDRRYPSQDYSVILDDKLLFERYFGGQGLPVVKSFGLLFPHLFYSDLACGTLLNLALDPWPEDIYGAFLKPVTGSYGSGAFKMWSQSERRDSDFDGSRLNVTGVYLVQEAVQQHPDIGKFHEASLNTLRLVSFIDADGAVSVDGGFFRMGAGGAVVDNASAGGVVCGVDVLTGILHEVGYQCSKNAFYPIGVHPTSREKFAATQLPFFEEALEIVQKAHKLTPWIRSIGWDVAITRSGPLLIEGNHWWGALSIMWVDPSAFRGFMDKFSE